MPVTANDPLDRDQMRVLDVLYDVADPELGVNVVDLGLVRAIELEGGVARVTMTLTSPACPLTDELEDEVRARVRDHHIASDASVTWAFNPPWQLSDVTYEGRDQLRALGFSA